MQRSTLETVCLLFILFENHGFQCNHSYTESTRTTQDRTQTNILDDFTIVFDNNMRDAHNQTETIRWVRVKVEKKHPHPR